MIEVETGSRNPIRSAQLIEFTKSFRVQCSKGKEQNFQFWKFLAVVLDTHTVDKVHKRSDSALVMLPLI